MSLSKSPLVELGEFLKSSGYRFIAITPASHARLNARMPEARAENLRDVFGWSRLFDAGLLPPPCLDLLKAAHALEAHGELYKSKVRYASLGDDLFVHSAFPTLAADSVFFGPDTYRFARFIAGGLAGRSAPGAPLVVDVGAGSGAGGLHARRVLGTGVKLVLSDISPKALDFSRVNAALAGCHDASCILSDLFAELGEADVILANPPYLLDAEARIYRDGGGALGSALSTRIVAEGLPRLRRGGVMLLYTGAVIVDCVDAFRESLRPLLARDDIEHTYEELDPDVFGEELDNPAYGRAERVAAVGLTVRRAD